MDHLADAFKHFRSFTVLVIGDFFFDAYITGRVKRISPEAPVPVLEVAKQTFQPGGAGNVVVNFSALMARIFAVGRVGNDSEGQKLKSCLEAEGVDVSAFITEPDYKTPVKHRFIGDSQQLLRVDFETVHPLSSELEEQVIARLPTLIQQSDLVAISDYAKGFLSRRLISTIIQEARAVHIPVIVDPKGIDFAKYKYATILKPNLQEAYAAASMPMSASLDAVAESLLNLSQVDMLLITRSEAGMSLFERGKARKDFPVHAKEVKDVTGAGDTVLAFIGLALACGLDMDQGIRLANTAACISIERLGCVQVTLAQVSQRLLETDRDMKVFDNKYSYVLRYMLKDKSYSLLILQNGRTITSGLLQAINKLSAQKDHRLIVYVNDACPTDEFTHLLSSLHSVAMIVLRGEGVHPLCDMIHPDEVYCFEGGQLSRRSDSVDLLSILRNQSQEVQAALVK